MNAFCISLKTSDSEQFIKYVAKSFAESGLHFQLSAIENSSLVKKDNNHQRILNVEETKNKKMRFEAGIHWHETYALIMLDLNDARLLDNNTLIALAEKLALQFPESKIEFSLLRQTDSSYLVTSVSFDFDENAKLFFDKINASIKKIIHGRPFLVYDQQMPASLENGGLIFEDNITVKQLGTGIVEESGLRIFHRMTSIGKAYEISQGKWPNAHLGISTVGLSIDDARKELQKILKDRGYEIVKFPQVKNES